MSEEWCRVNNNPIHTVYGNLKCFLCHLQELKLIGLDIPHFAADLPLNRCKNRYTNILPCKIVNSADPAYVFQRLKDGYSKLISFSSLWPDPGVVWILEATSDRIHALMSLDPIICRKM